MAFIYCITNVINNKMYVGKTTTSITQRFKEHCKDSKKERCEKRPLYDAMNKYGIENFVVSQLIECEPDELDSYEVLFIEKLDTYHNGYNATKGGDGSILFDYKEIINLYQQNKSMIEVARLVGCCTDTVSKVIHMYNIPLNQFYAGSCQQPLKVIRLDKNSEEELEEYNSIADAARWCVDNGYAKTYNGGVRQKISMCAQGKLKTAYKFKWKQS